MRVEILEHGSVNLIGAFIPGVVLSFESEQGHVFASVPTTDFPSLFATIREWAANKDKPTPEPAEAKVVRIVEAFKRWSAQDFYEHLARVLVKELGG